MHILVWRFTDRLAFRDVISLIPCLYFRPRTVPDEWHQSTNSVGRIFTLFLLPLQPGRGGISFSLRPINKFRPWQRLLALIPFNNLHGGYLFRFPLFSACIVSLVHRLPALHCRLHLIASRPTNCVFPSIHSGRLSVIFVSNYTLHTYFIFPRILPLVTVCPVSTYNSCFFLYTI